jgi:protease-4
MLAFARWAIGRALGTRQPAAWVELNLEGAYHDLAHPRSRLARLLRPAKTSLLELHDDIARIADDENIRGVLLRLRPIEVNTAQLDVLRNLVRCLRDANKQVVAWSHMYDSATYYVASAASAVSLQPGGHIEPLGVAASGVFLADSLADIGISVEVERVSRYKSALDPMSRRGFSPESQEMTEWLLDDRFNAFVGAVANGRDLDDAQVRRIVSDTPLPGARALDQKLVDELETYEALRERLGIAHHDSLDPWRVAVAKLARPRPHRPGPRIALIPVEGAIVDGHSGDSPLPLPRLPFLFQSRAGDLTVTRAVRDAERDPHVAGVVLYVDSGGGSATASEAMHSALTRLAATKPLVVSMGGVAASGGYYVALPGSRIFALPGTITGSIGVLIARVRASELLNRLDVHRAQITRGGPRDFWSVDREMSEADRERVRELAAEAYALFCQRVTDSRGLTGDTLDRVALGRVWTGSQALDHGLIDEHGSLADAIQYARRAAGVRDDAPVHISKTGGLLPGRGEGALVDSLAPLRLLRSGPMLMSSILGLRLR